MGQPELAVDGRFALGERVGRGAFGEILRAVDRRTGKPAAIKRLREHLDDPLILDRFEREARILRSLDSPHVVRYLAHGADARGRPCIALEWLEGADLAHVMRGERAGAAAGTVDLCDLTTAEAIEVARQAALGLHALHARGIVHRDVKPTNFFVLAPEAGAPHLRVKLIDLGVARGPDEDALTAVGGRIGTPRYMSPEQARGEADITFASDLFSLGLVLYEMLAGARPFSGDDELVVLTKIVLHDPPPLAEHRPDLPPLVGEIVARALAREPAARFPSARALADALAQAAALDLPGGGSRPCPRPGSIPGDDPTSVPARSGIALAAREQRVVTAVFAGLAGAAPGASTNFRMLALEHGASSHRGQRGQEIAVFGGARSSGDEAIRGARLALAAAEKIPGAQLSVLTGRVLVGEGGLTAEAIERRFREPRAGEGIALDVATARLLGGQLWVEEVGEEAGKEGGKAGGGGYVLRGERAAIPAVAPRLLGREMPMVGRDRELAALLGLYDECAGEPVARAVLVTGPAGAGKSRLRYELIRRLAGRDPAPLVLTARGESLRAGSPYALAAGLVRSAAGLGEGEAPRAQLRKLDRRLAEVIGPEDHVRVRDRLAELVGVSGAPGGPAHVASPGAQAARGDLLGRGDAKRLAFEDWIAAECARRPVVVVLEDLHWGDLPTVRLVGGALAAARDRPLFVVALARPEVHEVFPDLWKDRHALEQRLMPLTRSASERLVREALGDQVDEATARALAERAEGNPFWLEEMIRAVAEGQAGLPATVLGMAQARLDALGPECKRALRAASVFGERFYQAGVVALAAGGPGAQPASPSEPPAWVNASAAAGVGAALDELCRREILVRRPHVDAPGKVELAFRHALLREAAYASLEPEDRAVGHRLAADFLEASRETDALTLARHRELGGQPDRALGWYQRAAEQALEGNDLDAAVDRARLGIARGAEGKALGQLLLVQAQACRWRGDTEEAIRCGVEAAALLPRGDRPWIRAVSEVIAGCGRRGAWAEMERWLGEAAAVTPADRTRSDQIACLCPGAGQLLQAGRDEAAEAIWVRVQEIAGGGRLEPFALARLAQLRGFRAFRAGDLEAAQREYLGAIALLEGAGDPRNACMERINLGFVSAELGDLERAEEVLLRCLAGAMRMHLGVVQGYALLNLGRVLLDGGRLDEAAGVSEQARDMGLANSSPRLVGAALTHLANIAYRAGDPARAEAHARAAEDALAVTPPLRAGALAACARALLALGRAGEALEMARRALALIEGGRHEMFHALVRLVHAEALDAAGERAAAAAAIGAARAEVLAAADRIRDEGARARFLTRVEVNARTLALADAWYCVP